MNAEALQALKDLTDCRIAHLGDPKHVIKECTPILYHYTNIYALQNILKNSAIWLSKCDYLNDRSELKYAEDLILELLEDYTKETVKEQCRQILFHAKKRLENTYILSLTGNEDSLILWANYSKEEGYNLGLNLDHLLHSIWEGDTYLATENPDRSQNNSTNVNSFDIMFDRVIYGKSEQISMIRQVIENADTFYNKYCYAEKKEQLEVYIRFIMSALLSFLLFFKDESFRFEQEYRLVIILKDKEYAKSVISHKILNGAFIPFIKVCVGKGHYCDGIPLESIKVGPRNHSDIALKGMKSFLEVNGYSNIHVTESKIPLRY